MSTKINFPKKGEIWLSKFEKVKELSKPFRPVLVISNDLQNEFDNSIAAVPLTTEDLANIEPYQVFVNNSPETGLDYPSKILLNYPFTFDKELRLVKKLGIADKETMKQVKSA
jgi:mRNA-degrading endonuclease toxin of MazEF toxin-antitoxin module